MRSAARRGGDAEGASEGAGMRGYCWGKAAQGVCSEAKRNHERGRGQEQGDKSESEQQGAECVHKVCDGRHSSGP